VLVDNVFAHTPDGTAFGVQLVRDDEAVRLVVTDQGPGPGPARPQGPGHTGLGLEIVRRSIGPVGGSLAVRPAPEGGTVVAVRLPLGPGGDPGGRV
jgi:signal transduction histidine kinase